MSRLEAHEREHEREKSQDERTTYVHRVNAIRYVMANAAGMYSGEYSSYAVSLNVSCQGGKSIR